MKNNFIITQIKKTKEKQINTRFPPEPNGLLHLGHIKSIILNYYLASKYNGKFYLRFDDTNPTNETINFVNLIKNDLYWLNCCPFEIKYTSNYFDFFFLQAKKLVLKNKAYIDQLTITEFNSIKGNLNTKGINSKYKNRNIQDSLFLLKRMKKGFFLENQACLRANISMTEKYLILRDPIIFRIKFSNHYRLKKTWCIYPMYDFSHCISDLIEKINFSLCTLEFVENKILYNWFLDQLFFGVNKPIQLEFARLEIQHVSLSKTKLSNFFINNTVKSWENPNLFTILGMRNRGIPAVFLKEFCNKIGYTRKKSLIEIKYFESLLNKFLYKKSTIYMCIIDNIDLIIDNLKDNFLIIKSGKLCNLYTLYLTKHILISKKEINQLINKKIFFFKLRFSFYCKIKKIIKNINNSIIQIKCDYINIEYFIRNIHVLNWVSNIYKIPIKYNKYYNYSQFYENKINQTYTIGYGYAPLNLKYLNIMDIVHFERIGYFNIISINHNLIELNTTYLF